MSLNHSLLRRRRVRQISANSESCESRSLLSANPISAPEAHSDSDDALPKPEDHHLSIDPSHPGFFIDCLIVPEEFEDIGPSDDRLAVTFLVGESQPGPEMTLESVGPPVHEWDPSWEYYVPLLEDSPVAGDSSDYVPSMEGGPVPGGPISIAPGEFHPTIESPIDYHGGPIMTTPPDVFPTTLESPDGSTPGSNGPGNEGLLYPEGWHPSMDLVHPGPGFDPESLILPPEGFLNPDNLCPGPEDSPIDQMNPDAAHHGPESYPDAGHDREAFPEYRAESFSDLDRPFDDLYEIAVNQMWSTELLPDDVVQPKDEPRASADDLLPEIAYLNSIPEEAGILFTDQDHSDFNPLASNIKPPDAVPVAFFARSVPDLGEELSLNITQTKFTMSDSVEHEVSDEHFVALSSDVSGMSDDETDASVQLITVNQILTVNQWIPRRMNSMFHSMSTPSASDLTEQNAEHQSRSRAPEATQGSGSNAVRSGRSSTSSVASQPSMALRKRSVSPLFDSLMSDSLTESELSDGQQSEDLSESVERKSQQSTDSPTSRSQPVNSDKSTGRRSDASAADQSLSRQRITPTGTQRQIDHFMSQFAQDSFVG
jgi:hypothetical protein